MMDTNVFGSNFIVAVGELPFSMKLVHEQRADVRFDTPNPLYKFGFGLLHSGAASTA